MWWVTRSGSPGGGGVSCDLSRLFDDVFAFGLESPLLGFLGLPLCLDVRDALVEMMDRLEKHRLEPGQRLVRHHRHEDQLLVTIHHLAVLGQVEEVVHPVEVQVKLVAFRVVGEPHLGDAVVEERLDLSHEAESHASLEGALAFSLLELIGSCALACDLLLHLDGAPVVDDVHNQRSYGFVRTEQHTKRCPHGGATGHHSPSFSSQTAVPENSCVMGYLGRNLGGIILLETVFVNPSHLEKKA